ncbi:hypothetical protein [uncultured Helicobacter sp.]|uniref:hypothetical protein n=1 Tax=uncultured Helicobacter sp. TaxID=175537 RepID=UPI00258F1E9C|nr:hypothetical protein [uncultured Helicobacter sp.]
MLILACGVIAAVMLYCLFFSGLPNAKILFCVLVGIICLAIPRLGAMLVAIGLIFGFVWLLIKALKESKQEDD